MSDTFFRIPRSRVNKGVARANRLGTTLRIVASSAALLLAGISTAHAAPPAFLASGQVVAAPAGATALCRTYPWSCAGKRRRAALPSSAVALAESVNRSVNRQVREITDIAQYRRQEHWALPTSRGGDCEDLALLKMRELLRRGVAPERLLMATAFDSRRGAHAVLILRTDRGDLVLDNLTDRILPWWKTGYSFLRMQNPNDKRGWVAVMAGGIFETDRAVASVTRGN